MNALRNVIVLLALLVTGIAAAPAAAHHGSPVDVWPALAAPQDHPPGVNPARCAFDEEHPVPLVLLHGGSGSSDVTWPWFSKPLVADGWCVYAVNYGARATRPVPDMAREVGAFIDDVLRRSGARKVSIVSYSLGGVVSRYWIRFLGGASKVEDLVSVGSPQHGTSAAHIRLLEVSGCHVCFDARPGSRLMRRLNAGEEAPEPVDYTSIATRTDFWVVPYTSPFLDGPADRVTNVLLQDKCPLDVAEHLTIIGHPVVFEWAANALEREGPADPAFRPTCFMERPRLP